VPASRPGFDRGQLGGKTRVFRFWSRWIRVPLPPHVVRFGVASLGAAAVGLRLSPVAGAVVIGHGHPPLGG